MNFILLCPLCFSLFIFFLNIYPSQPAAVAVVAERSHVQNDSTQFDSPLRITILIIQNWKQYIAIQIAGRPVLCVTYNIKPSLDTIKHAQWV